MNTPEHTLSSIFQNNVSNKTMFILSTTKNQSVYIELIKWVWITWFWYQISLFNLCNLYSRCGHWYVCDSRGMCENQVWNLQMRFIFTLETLCKGWLWIRPCQITISQTGGLKMSLCSRFWFLCYSCFIPLPCIIPAPFIELLGQCLALEQKKKKFIAILMIICHIQKQEHHDQPAM